MQCDCGNVSAPRMSYRGGRWLCSQCSDVAFNTWIPDVYWDANPCDHAVDDNGNPMTFLGKRHKALWLREHGISEAGDRVHGAPISCIPNERKPDREKIRREVRESYFKAKETMKRKYR